MNNEQRIKEIEKRLKAALRPVTLEIIDDSEQHREHLGAQGGAGHFRIKISASIFQEKSLPEQHRMVYAPLADMMVKDIHALQIESKATNTTEILNLVVNTLTDLKAKDIKVLDVHTLTNVTDHFVICTATSTRQAASLADKLITAVKKAGVRPFNSIEDQVDTGWILVDLLDIVVHIMLAETREFYSLEKLWSVTENIRNQNDDTNDSPATNSQES